MSAHFEMRFASRRSRCLMPVLVLLMVLGVVLAACGTGIPTPSRPASGPSTTASLATSAAPEAAGLVSGAMFLTIHRGQPSPTSTLQLRDARDGTVLRTVFQSDPPTPGLSVAVTPQGQVVAAQTSRCRTTLLSVDPGTGHQRTLRTVAEAASSIAVSPDGTKLAYLTEPACSTSRCPGTCAGTAAFLPNVLVIMDLASGRSVRTATDNPGHPLVGPTWSPDGREVAAEYLGDARKLLVFDASAPRFATARAIAARPGCSYAAASWAASAVLAVEGCDSVDPALSPRQLVKITPNGTVLASWSLPDCIDGVDLATTPTGSQTMVDAHIGYGNDRCATAQASGLNPLTHIVAVDGAQLRPVIDLHAVDEVSLAGY